jgi:hypothetical protein
MGPIGPSTNKSHYMKLHYLKNIIICALLVGAFHSCKTDNKNEKSTDDAPVKNIVKIPAFNGDSAYQFVAKQVEFGPRVPGTDEHVACKNWLVGKLNSYGADVIEQDFVAKIYTGDKWNATNIIGQFNKDAKKRVVLAAHWDSRMIAEEDSNEEKREEPILGADDGASGVGVLLEIARLLQENPIDLGVDIVFFDAEDQGKRGANSPPEHWCLGAQHWSRNPHRSNYKPQYGILLDMVGSKNPSFGKDAVSRKYASKILDKVWTLAQNMGYSDMFVNTETSVTDDHYFVNIIAGIPMIDIINQPPNSKTSFGSHWHTHKDDMNIINKRSLKVVGQVVTAAIYKTNNGQF